MNRLGFHLYTNVHGNAPHSYKGKRIGVERQGSVQRLCENEKKLLSLFTKPKKKQKEKKKKYNEIPFRCGSLGISSWRGFNVVEGYNASVVKEKWCVEGGAYSRLCGYVFIYLFYYYLFIVKEINQGKDTNTKLSKKYLLLYTEKEVQKKY